LRAEEIANLDKRSIRNEAAERQGVIPIEIDCDSSCVSHLLNILVRLVNQSLNSYNALTRTWFVFRYPCKFPRLFMSVPSINPTHRWTAAELRRLPPEERDAILAAAANQAAEEYRNNLALTAFEAFGEKDLYVNSSDTQPR
jgi:hypothetical protein